ncbi:cell envelope integrity TolA C-terminal domain-containing protein [Salmonella enterica]
MVGLKTFRLLPFCLLLLVNQSFASGNSATGADIVNYARVVQKTIEDRGGARFSNYKGKVCNVRIHLVRDGTLTGASIEGGLPDLCNELLKVMYEVKKFPDPPSDAVYRVFKDATLDFKP